MTSLLNYFSYETLKYVKVEDPRLGCLRIILLLLIVAYVGIVEMAYMGGYLEATRVVGAVRFSLEQPRIGCDGMYSDQENCTNAFAPLDTLPYCQQSIKVQEDSLFMNAEEMEITSTSRALRSNDYMGLVYPCQIYEAVNAQLMRESSMVVWTRASTQNQSLICDGTQENTCPQTYESHGNQEPFYIAQSEGFTLLLEHAATASHICETKSQHYSHYSCSAQAANYPQSGRLLSLSHGLCQQAHANGQRAYSEPLKEEHVSHAPCYIAPNRTSNNHDFFSLDVLLKAAGIASLDDCLTTTNATSCTTVRESGATILLTVLWNDFLPYRGIVEPYYHYKARIIGTDYKETHAFYNSYRDSRTLFSAHGIKVAVVIGGNFHQFTWLNFIITITTALGMLAVATAVVDMFMLYILPERLKYQECKYELVQRPTMMMEDGQEEQVENGDAQEEGPDETMTN